MNTPIHDFVIRYRDLRPARFHMPGHKGRGPLGCEELDLTEIPGADSLYEANGIIAESEANASRLFGCPTFYSTEGSSHCIRAMLCLAREACQGIKDQGSGIRERGEFRVLAARNVHKAFLTAAALLDLDVCWLPLSGGSYLSAQPTPEILAAALAETGARAVYLTCPDYLGFLPDLKPLAEVCHAHGALSGVRRSCEMDRSRVERMRSFSYCWFASAFSLAFCSASRAVFFSRLASVPVMSEVRNMTTNVTGYPGSRTCRLNRGATKK